METCDVLIVGGGPAGSSCAWKLRQAGIDVVVLDKSSFPRDKVCAGWITPPVLADLAISPDEFEPHGIMQPITRFLTGLIDGPEIETNYGRVVSYGVRRCEFDHFLLLRSSARLRLGEPFRSIRQENGSWIVNEEVRSRYVVGAGGHFCPVARWIGSSENPVEQPDSSCSPAQPTVVAQEVEFKMTESQQQRCAVLPDRPELYFCHDLKGYGWVFRKENVLNVGLGREGEPRLSTHVKAFVQSLVGRGKIPGELSAHFHGHAYRLRTALPNSKMPPNLLLVGDAAGLADCRSGEGIRPAIESGLLAADSIIETGAEREEELGVRYAEKLRQKFGVPRRTIIFDWIPSPLLHFAARQLMNSHLFTRRVLLDQWFLHI